MNSLTRFVGYSVLLLIAFLVAAIAAQKWLHRQSQLARAEALNLRRVQLETAIRLWPRSEEQWDQTYQRTLGGLISGTVTIVDRNAPLPPPPSDPNLLAFTHPVEISGQSFHLRVVFPVPTASRLLTVYQKATVGLLLLGAVLLWVVALLAILSRRMPDGETATRSPWQRSRAEMGSLEHLAKTSAAQRQALDHERDNRRRAEQDAELKQGLLNRSLEERIGLGRDLHDGIIQSLYAVGLTLESVRSLVQTNPAEADRRLEQCRENLNGTIRDVRHYIGGLAPDSLRRAGFTQALEALFTELGASRDVNFDLKVDDEATALLTPEQSTEALQIAREAVSNALRHGGASLITLRLHKSDREVCLLVQDNGTGFDASQRRDGGHGLTNMQARAQRVGASTTVTSKPGEGTRVVVMLTTNPLMAS
jgi:signal transduction histidine kinase